MTSLRGFPTSSQISIHIQLLHPKCITKSRKGNKINNYMMTVSFQSILNSDISFSCSSLDLKLVPNSVSSISVSLSCTNNNSFWVNSVCIPGSSSINYSFVNSDGSTAPSWITLDAGNRKINTTTLLLRNNILTILN